MMEMKFHTYSYDSHLMLKNLGALECSVPSPNRRENPDKQSRKLSSTISSHALQTSMEYLQGVSALEKRVEEAIERNIIENRRKEQSARTMRFVKSNRVASPRQNDIHRRSYSKTLAQCKPLHLLGQSQFRQNGGLVARAVSDKKHNPARPRTANTVRKSKHTQLGPYSKFHSMQETHSIPHGNVHMMVCPSTCSGRAKGAKTIKRMKRPRSSLSGRVSRFKTGGHRARRTNIAIEIQPTYPRRPKSARPSFIVASPRAMINIVDSDSGLKEAALAQLVHYSEETCNPPYQLRSQKPREYFVRKEKRKQKRRSRKQYSVQKRDKKTVTKDSDYVYDQLATTVDDALTSWEVQSPENHSLPTEMGRVVQEHTSPDINRQGKIGSKTGSGGKSNDKEDAYSPSSNKVQLEKVAKAAGLNLNLLIAF